MPPSLPLYFHVASTSSRPGNANEDAVVQGDLGDGNTLLALCDGTGGPDVGDLAAHLAAATLEDYLREHKDLPVPDRLFGALEHANDVVVHESSFEGGVKMSVAVVVALVQESEAWAAWTGGGRLLHLREGAVHVSSTDTGFPRAPTRVGEAESLRPLVLKRPLLLQEGDALVLATDSVLEAIQEWEVSSLVSGRTSADGAQTLLETARERGGPEDFSTALVVAGQDLFPKVARPSAPPASGASDGPDPLSRMVQIVVPAVVLFCVAVGIFLGWFFFLRKPTPVERIAPPTPVLPAPVPPSRAPAGG